MYQAAGGPGSVVSIATGYGLDGPGIESRWGDEIFRIRPDRPRCLLNLLHIGYRVVYFRGSGDLITNPNLAPRLKKEFRYTSTSPQCFMAGYRVLIYLLYKRTYVYMVYQDSSDWICGEKLLWFVVNFLQ